jgi:PleD family two-component response regulator
MIIDEMNNNNQPAKTRILYATNEGARPTHLISDWLDEKYELEVITDSFTRLLNKTTEFQKPDLILVNAKCAETDVFKSLEKVFKVEQATVIPIVLLEDNSQEEIVEKKLKELWLMTICWYHSNGANFYDVSKKILLLQKLL